LEAEADVNRALETIRKNIKISPPKNMGYYELKRL
jgi:hypothetical protein